VSAKTHSQSLLKAKRNVDMLRLLEELCIFIGDLSYRGRRVVHSYTRIQLGSEHPSDVFLAQIPVPASVYAAQYQYNNCSFN
jgi:hypothetical protein